MHRYKESMIAWAGAAGGSTPPASKAGACVAHAFAHPHASTGVCVCVHVHTLRAHMHGATKLARDEFVRSSRALLRTSRRAHMHATARRDQAQVQSTMPMWSLTGRRSSRSLR